MTPTSDQTFQIVQFVHPGFEYQTRKHVGPRSQRSGVMEWKEGKSAHDRKFMLTGGSLFDPETGEDHISVPIAFWGEWEGPSVFWRIDPAGKPGPSILHAPLRPTECPTTPVQNTDPMVFGNAFIYSNCMQRTYRSLRSLSPGSIVLFGRYSREDGTPAFSLDTCLVIDRGRKLSPIPFDEDTHGVDLLEDAVLKPLYTEGAREELTVYLGRRRAPNQVGPFSFFPARLMFDAIPTFARPELRPVGPLASVVRPGNMQGIKSTTHNVADRDAVWAEVVRQVVAHGCGLGYHAEAPPLLERAAAESASEREPLVLDAKKFSGR